VAVVGAVALAAVPATASAQECSNTAPAATALPEPAVRAALRCLVNATRARHGAPAVRPDARLNLAADGHSADMVARRYFAHVTPDGRSLSDRVRATGYLARSRDWALGEDIAWGAGSASTPASIFRAWMNSPPHRRVILDREFRELGVGVTRGVPVPGEGDGATFVLDFGDVR
jgi:uncharacterized protein YkwD